MIAFIARLDSEVVLFCFPVFIFSDWGAFSYDVVLSDSCLQMNMKEKAAQVSSLMWQLGLGLSTGVDA